MKLNFRLPRAAMVLAASLSYLPAASAGWIDDSPMCMLRCAFLPTAVAGEAATIVQPPAAAAAPAVPAAIAASIREQIDQAISDISCRWYGSYDAARDQVVELGLRTGEFLEEANRWADANRPLESLDQWVVPQIDPAEASGPRLVAAPVDAEASEDETCRDFDLLEPYIAASAAACGEIWGAPESIGGEAVADTATQAVPVISLPSRDAIANFIVRMPIELPAADAQASDVTTGGCCPIESLIQPEQDPHEMFATNILPRLDLRPTLPSLTAGAWRNAKQVTIRSKLLFVEEAIAGEADLLPEAAPVAELAASPAAEPAVTAMPSAESAVPSVPAEEEDDAVRLVRALRGWIHSADEHLAALENRCVRAAAAGGRLAR